MGIMENLRGYINECLEKGARASIPDSERLGQPSNRGFQLGYNQGHWMSEPDIDNKLTINLVRSLRITVDALALRELKPCRGHIPAGDDSKVIEDTRKSFEAERALFMKYFPPQEFPDIYSQ